jgi:hypothetical protein
LATTVYTTEEITLQDNRDATLRPLNIKGLRKFMQKMQEFGEVETEEEGLDILLDAAAICLMKQHPDLWDKKKHPTDDPNVFKGGYSEEAEDALDMPTVYRILDICGGVKLNDPNLIAAGMEALGQT